MKAKDRLGAGVGGPVAFAFADAIDARWDALLAVVNEISAAPNLWEDELPTWGLMRASRALKVNPDPSWTATEWLYCLRLRALARTITGAYPRTIELAQVASPFGVGTVDMGPVGVIAYVAGGSILTDAQIACLIAAFQLAKPGAAELQILGSEDDDVFTFDDDDLGLDKGKLADTLFP